ncbi:MAG: hypothetical protein JWN48_1169 [Myxococcaceae bacterium]|nr:hypothetical protein [Myxococcaceae bacterium]
MPLPLPRPLRLAMLLCLSCAPSQVRPPQAPPASAASSASAGQAPRVPGGVLPRSARYADLVRSATELEGSARPPSSCLLMQTASDFRLQGELSSAVRPLPLPPEDLDEPLKSAAHVELLGAWGRHGDGNGKLALAAFTSSAPTPLAFALLLTDRGIALRSPSGSHVSPVDGLDLAGALATLSQVDPERRAGVFVTAEASVPLSELYRVLSGLTSSERQVTLAVSLAGNTALPLPLSATTKSVRCPDGLSATSEPEGSLPASAIVEALAPLKERAGDCLSRGDARGAAGGRLTLAMRIAESGHVQEACVSTDQLDDPGVAKCVIDVAGQLVFPRPNPGGVIDIELPISLQASPQPAQHATCGPP